ncbi:MAG: hypothetical protein ABI723_18915 [Bacteroidia bacterium]
MRASKIEFLSKTFPEFALKLKPHANGKWGKMNAQQMVEHMSYSLRQANGKDPKTILTPADSLEKAKAFMMSDKPFRENTKNIELPEIPHPVKKPNMEAAVHEMKDELLLFFQTFEGNEDKTITNPFFGELNFMEWLQLLHKHVMHHAKQFGFEEK